MTRWISLSLCLGWAGLSALWAAEAPGKKPGTAEPPLLFSGWRWGGGLSLNHRNICPPPIKTEIETQALPQDIFFRIEAPVLEETPFLMEYALDADGRPQLYRLA